MKKPALTFWQIWNMSFGFLGIQFGLGLQNANVSRIFQSLGADVDRLAVYWLAAPVTGLIIQPIIGHYSDRTWCRLGRRRPYFLIGAILSSVALLVMPNAPALWVAVGTLWILDASINVSMEPFRAFVGDMLPPEQRTQGFATQSFFIGTGAVVASFLPYMMSEWFNVSNVAAAGEQIPLSVKLSFYIGGFVLLAAVLWTVFHSKEYSPEKLQAFDVEGVSGTTSVKTSFRSSIELTGRFFRNGTLFLIIGMILSYLFYIYRLEKELYILTGGLMVFGIIQLVTGFLVKQTGLKTEL